MKKNIRLTEFVDTVRKELAELQIKSAPSYRLGEVELEVTVGLDYSGGGKEKLIVMELGERNYGYQTHKIKLRLSPEKESIETHNAQPSKLPINNTELDTTSPNIYFKYNS